MRLISWTLQSGSEHVPLSDCLSCLNYLIYFLIEMSHVSDHAGDFHLKELCYQFGIG
jgi:hypothetical protein